ncbi:hypothetical protein IJS18_01775 [Candidatus Saccharibacteria bacterium]|nr:hypothetical protein [Candidatus Saccharibacteria bacterium]
MAREINLVPDIKGEMIKALKMRNFIFFLCIIVASASVGVILFFAMIAGGQQAVADGKKTMIENLSKKMKSYNDLGDFLTIRDQLGNLSAISKNKKLLSRSFSVLSALLPKGADRITISELNIDLSGASPTISFDAQANAGEPPYIDYNVLDSFKKSMQYMRYDYGNYVDKNGSQIPAYCMIESGADGATFSDKDRGYYAYWLITGEGCNPSYEPEEKEEKNDNEEGEEGKETEETEENVLSEDEISRRTAGYTTQMYDDQVVVKVWRTPQYNDWYKTKEVEGEPYMDIDGSISGVAHFESQCITYSGTLNETTGAVSWSSENNSCYLVPDGSDGIRITDSSNGRDSSQELVLRFSATITLTPDVFRFSNNHVLSIGPSGRYNVTDSYVQIQDMFAQKAADCAPGDTSCNNSKNSGGNN